MKVVAYVPDLMDRSKVAGAAGDVVFVTTPSALADTAIGAGADVVVVDLSRPGVLEILTDVPVAVIGFGSHVDRDLLARARAAGCDQVLARSAFFSRVGELLGG